MRRERLTIGLAAAVLLAACAKGKDPPAETPRILIEAGTFSMGTDRMDPCGDSRVNSGGSYVLGCNAKDQSAAIPHRVTLEAFCMDATEVTNLQFRHCVEHEACSKPESTNIGGQNTPGFIKSYYTDTEKYGDFPVAGVSWESAKAYCEFHGGSLPTEAQWEFAASSRGAVAGHLPVWEDTRITEAVNAGACDEADTQITLAPCTDGKIRAVGSSAADATAEGVLDLAGSVREWVADDFDFLAYCDQASITDDFTMNDGGTRPLFAAEQSLPPEHIVTDAACLDNGTAGYAGGCNPGLLECRGVCASAFQGEDPGQEKRATWLKADCRARHVPGANVTDLSAGGSCQADCEARGPDGDACTDFCACLTRDVDSTFGDTACLQACLGEYQICADACTIADVRATCMEVDTGGNDPVLPRPVCVARADQDGETPHARPEAFDTGRIAGSRGVRGGGFNETDACAGTISRRDFETASSPLLGFRCVYPASTCR